jgi:hypothetical protein
MDLSKLPKMSNTPPPAAAAPEPVAASPDDAPTYTPRPTDRAVGAEVWLSAIIGIIVMLMGRTFLSWAVASLTGQPFHTGWTWPNDDPRAGQEVSYWQLQGHTALSDMSIFLFGLAMVMEAVVLLAVAKQPRPWVWLVAFALVLTLGVTALNLVTVFIIMGGGGGLPLLSLLAVAFGGYMAMHEMALLKAAAAAPSA